MAKKTKVATKKATKSKAAPKAKPSKNEGKWINAHTWQDSRGIQYVGSTIPKHAMKSRPVTPTKPSMLPHIDPAAGKFASAASQSKAPVKCSQCGDEHALRERRMWNVSNSVCPMCGYNVYVEVDDGQEHEPFPTPPQPAQPSEMLLRYEPGTAVYVKWPPGPPRRGLMRGYNRNGKPVVAMARVDHQGAYTGDVPDKGRTFEPSDIVGPVEYNKTEEERLTNALRDTPIETNESAAAHEARVLAELGGTASGIVRKDATEPKWTPNAEEQARIDETVNETKEQAHARMDAMERAELDDPNINPARRKVLEKKFGIEKPKRTRVKKADKAADEAPPWDAPVAKPVEAKAPPPSPVPRQSDDTKPAHSAEAKCPKCTSFLILTRSQSQRVCSRCDYFEVARDGAWLSGDALPPAETTAPAAATDTDVEDLPMLDDETMPVGVDSLPTEGSEPEERAPWE